MILASKKSSRVKQKPKTVESVTTDKEHVNVVFIGHVDAGKSTIGGQMMYLTGMVDKRTLEKYEKEAKEKNRETWYLSWCMDTNNEEREEKPWKLAEHILKQRKSILLSLMLLAISPSS